MDLDDFEAGLADEPGDTRNEDQASMQDALRIFDETWFSARSRAARWMDLIGDYAGMECFAIDGDALIQCVLDDPLLRLAREGDLSFQLVHAVHSLEKLLRCFVDRQANFDVVFWEYNRHLTCAVGADRETVTSATLARTLLARHLQFRLSQYFEVYVFTDLSDPSWLDYVAIRKPMFVTTSDGGQPPANAPSMVYAAALAQRSFAFDLLSSGISISILRDTVFRQTKIFAFVFEGRRLRNSRSLLGDIIWERITAARDELTASVAHESLALVKRASIHQDVPLDLFLTELVTSTLPISTNDVDRALGLLFVAHVILLDGAIPLRARGSSNVPTQRDQLQQVFGQDIGASIFDFLRKIFHQINLLVLKSPAHVSLDIDIHVFVRLLAVIRRTNDLHLGPLMQLLAFEFDRIQSIYDATGQPLPDLASLCTTQDHGAAEVSPPRSIISTIRLLPFTNPIFNNSPLGTLQLQTSDTLKSSQFPMPRFSPGLVYRDVHHWHNQKHILPTHQGGSGEQEASEWLKKKALKREQRFMAAFQKFAESLASTSAGLKQQTIAAVGQSRAISSRRQTGIDLPNSQLTVLDGGPTSPISPTTSTASTLVAASLKGSKAKTKPLTKKEALLLQIQAEKAASRQSDAQGWWFGRLAELEAMRSLEDRLVAAKNLASNKRMYGQGAEPAIAVDFQLYLIQLQLQIWIAQAPESRTQPDVHDFYSVQLLRDVSKTYRVSGHCVQTLAALDSVMISLGFDSYIASLRGVVGLGEIGDREMSFKFEKLVRSSGSLIHKWMRIQDASAVSWQLRVFGEYMDRSLDSRPDKRVPFEPDAWQRKVLDALDADDSVLVVAPTSAGKTFISFYAMEKVLRESDDGILVYVAPTKALVNQIAADVHARFRKNRNGKNFWAIHSRDYRVNDPQNCQILITVPEILSIMLLSPPLARVWTPRIKRIIMDEIHTIGEHIGGAVWEQILLLAPCPIIGLSATIGQPSEFNGWLAAVQRAHGFNHTYINHPHRYSHLRKFFYIIPSDVSARVLPTFTGLSEESYRSTDRARFIHPVTIIGLGATTLPSDFALEARDTLSFYNALVQHQAILPPEIVAELKNLEPSAFFAQREPCLLRQQDVLRYEADLVRVLQLLLAQQAHKISGSALQRVISTLRDPLLTSADETFDLDIAPSVDSFLANVIRLAADLHVSGDLPAIFFAFDRSHCEIMVQKIENDLKKAEIRWKAKSPVWAQKIRDWEAWKATSKDREREREKKVKAKAKRNTNEERDTASPPEAATEWQKSFDPDYPLEQFSFAGGNAAYLQSELEQDIHELAWASVPKWAIAALRRGVAVHHSGMNKKYRSLVERLFRLKFIRIVIATGTLALGINAPARTTVFCGDSPYLTALMYRQCAGRAGRRGFDLLGKVVFYGLPMNRVQRLVLSRLPALAGNFPLTCTLSLRLCNLLEGSNRSATAVRAIKSILSLPQLVFGSPVGQNQLLHHLRFSIEYLRRMNLLDREGRPLNLFAIASRLYYCEPSNLALVTLLQSGVIHEMCNQPSMLKAKKQFMLLMCHLFGRRYLPSTVIARSKSASMVVLPPMPQAAASLLRQHGQHILDIFSSYAMEYTTRHAAELDLHATELPLSGALRTPTESNSPFVLHLRDTSNPPTVRCPFVTTSGLDDDFATISELTASARDGLHLDHQAIPSMDIFLGSSPATQDRYSEVDAKRKRKDASQRATPQSLRLNAYLYDFYIHGQVEALVVDNGVRRGDVWYALDDFSLTLRTVRAALVEMLDASQVVGANDPSLVDTQPATPPAKKLVQKAKKTAEDDWDVSSDEEMKAEAGLNADEGLSSTTAEAATNAIESTTAAPSAGEFMTGGGDGYLSDDDAEAPRHFSLGGRKATFGDEDWRVLEVVNAVVEEFDAAFKKMWA
ncbi:P-loop containing nucleoside triphosphate hydrolase protein [Auriculariales sp. MPI-PUGE-AT-0066]|nr:P-loop containing nucleoside triphosphate hydrolase protein [Auriculariales sp. MPI-PUGE-AT-0066]